MKTGLKSSLLLFLLLISYRGVAQDISRVEYFFNEDPGFGQGAIVPVSQIGGKAEVEFSINTTGLEPGYHTLYIRTKNSDEEWGLPQKRLLFIKEAETGNDLDEAEYFFNKDPGVGQANKAQIAGNSSASTMELISAGLEEGFNTVFIRVKNSKEEWGLPVKRHLFIGSNSEQILIDRIEYYFDQDPGIGNASQLPLDATDEASLMTEINVDTVDQGFHTLYIRAGSVLKNKWGLPVKQMVYVQKKPRTEIKRIIKAEYYFDEDPGLGFGRSLSIDEFEIKRTDSASVQTRAVIDLSGLERGSYTLYVRALDDEGIWGIVGKKELTIKTGPKLTGVLPDTVYIEPEDVEVFFTEMIDIQTDSAFSIDSAFVEIESGFVEEEDFLSFNNTDTLDFLFSNNRLTLFGEGTPDQYEAALEESFYSNIGNGRTDTLKELAINVYGNGASSRLLRTVLKVKGVATSIGDEKELPDKVTLSQNYPNPFNPVTRINFSIPFFTKVELTVFNLLGQEVQTLLNENKAPGNYQVSFDGSGLTTGMYIYRIRAGEYTAIKKMLLIK